MGRWNARHRSGGAVDAAPLLPVIETIAGRVEYGTCRVSWSGQNLATHALNLRLMKDAGSGPEWVYDSAVDATLLDYDTQQSAESGVSYWFVYSFDAEEPYLESDHFGAD